MNLIDFESPRVLIQEVSQSLEIDLPTFKAPRKKKACFGSAGILKKASTIV
jgi:hypothetical protein